MRPADAYRLKYRSKAAEGQTIEPSNDESNTRGVDDDTGLFRPVEVRGTRGRIIGDAGIRSVHDLHDPEYEGADEPMMRPRVPVSYTHLTLPTILLV